MQKSVKSYEARFNHKRQTFNHALYTLQIGLNSVVGYLFLKVLALKLGTSSVKDGFDIAYSVPFIIMAVAGFSFLHGIVTAQFTKTRDDVTVDGNVLFSTLLNAMLIIGIAFMSLCIIFSGSITAVLAPGLPHDAMVLTQQLIQLTCPLVFTLGIGAYVSAVLAAYEIPIAMEFCQMTSRAGCIIWILLVNSHYALTSVASWLFYCSAIGMVVECIVVARCTGLRYRLVMDLKAPAIRQVGAQALGFMPVSICSMISMSYMRRLATIDGPGTTAAITYALTLVSPLTLIIGKPISLVTGPSYIKAVERIDHTEASRIFHRSAILAFGISVAVCLALYWTAPQLIALLYKGGKFDAASIDITYKLFRLFTWSVPPAVIVWVVLLPLLSETGSHTASIVYVTGYVIQTIATFILYHVCGKYGFAIAFVIGVCVQATIGWYFVRRRLSELKKASLCIV